VIVVETPDAVLVADRSRSQDVKKIVAAQCRRPQREHAAPQGASPLGLVRQHRRRPALPGQAHHGQAGASLSLQMHHHRAEHWIVVSGTAEGHQRRQVIMLTENQSTYIPLGQTHRLANPGKVPLEIIEVQSGSYLGEGRHRALRGHLRRASDAAMMQKDAKIFITATAAWSAVHSCGAASRGYTNLIGAHARRTRPGRSA
jgi:mannose-6-phosphate isomerase-like protein (cupin superfamily)